MEERNNEEFHEREEKKTEMKIDNNPDRINFSQTKDKIKRNPWMIVSIVLGIMVIVLLFNNFRGGVTGNVISGDSAGEKVVSYLNSRTGGGVSYISSEDLGGLYQISVSYNGDEIPVFATKDGGYFIQGAVPITGDVINNQEPSQQPPQNVPKSDKPKVELFVMTHCPYGTQAEKGFIPAIEALGDKIDSSVKFVHYFLHEPENDETPIQICIREEQGDKYLDYLKCFLEDGDSDRCLTKTGINKAKLDSCIETKYEGVYAEDSALSQGYGVKGSPTLVVNGQIVQSGRDSASYLSAICSAFNTAPAECDTQLSSTSPNPGFGYSVSGSATNTANAAAQC